MLCRLSGPNNKLVFVLSKSNKYGFIRTLGKQQLSCFFVPLRGGIDLRKKGKKDSVGLSHPVRYIPYNTENCILRGDFNNKAVVVVVKDCNDVEAKRIVNSTTEDDEDMKYYYSLYYQY